MQSVIAFSMPIPYQDFTVYACSRQFCMLVQSACMRQTGLVLAYIIMLLGTRVWLCPRRGDMSFCFDCHEASPEKKSITLEYLQILFQNFQGWYFSQIVFQPDLISNMASRNFDPLGYSVSIHAPNMAQKAKKSETGSQFHQTGRWVESWKRCIVKQNRLNFGPLGYIYSLHMPNMAKKAKQEVGSYLRNHVS